MGRYHTCHAKSGEVVELDLSSSCFHGKLSSKSSLFKLQRLRVLNLAYNDLVSSEIPSQLGTLKELTLLNLSNTLSSGTVPTELLHLTKLVSLDLSSNSLSAQKSFLNNLSQNLTNLEELNLGLVDISSEIPPNISKLSSLKSLSLDECTLPPNISALCNLETFEASENIFTGTLPSTLFNTPSLTYIDLKDNQLNAILEFGNISSPSKLERLSLGNNHFKGSLPISILSLVNLYSLDLSYYNTGMSVDFGFFLSQLKGVIDMDISYKNTTNIVDLSTIFLHLKSLSSLQLSGVHVSTAKMGLVSNLPTNLGTLHLSG
ncbi:receptor-like protein 32 [Brassica napus]|uniref:receptor-like protein 32 n=1 Tax=Brassica napus TaxID=3708 RepID=UPI0006AB6135|nr:receptor-like protein 32 [Brassica napus]XP_048627508.1 receptor-like protein 32 [Brassica napus]